MSEAKKPMLEVAVRMIAEDAEKLRQMLKELEAGITSAIVSLGSVTKLERLCELLAESEIAAKDLPKLIEQLEKIERENGPLRTLKVLIAELKSNLEEEKDE